MMDPNQLSEAETSGFDPYAHAAQRRQPDAVPRPAVDYAAAYSSLHEVVRAFLAGERNTKYLRRLHAEIESELTGGESRG